MAVAENIEAFPGPKSSQKSTSSSHGATYRPLKWYQIGGKDISHVSIDAGYEEGSLESFSSSLEDVTQKNASVFVAPEALDIYKPVEGFEGAHRFDPSATWSAAEEKRLVRKVRAETPIYCSILTRAARLENNTPGVHHVLCASAGPR